MIYFDVLYLNEINAVISRMKKLFFLLMVLFCLPVMVYGQENNFTFSGKVDDCKTHEGVSGVTVKVVGSDGTQVSVMTDSTGNYSFVNCFKLKTSYVAMININTMTGPHKGITYGNSSWAWYEDYGYLNSSDKHIFSFSESVKTQHSDFCLVPTYSCMFPFPDFKFKKNSTDFFLVQEWMYTNGNDTALDCFTALMMAKKNWVIEIAGHAASDEKDKDQLAMARAKRIADMLIARGIDPKRIQCVSFSDKAPYEYKDDKGQVIKTAAKNSEENRRIFLSVISKDYVPKYNDEITGNVYDCKMKNPVKDVKIKMIGSDGSSAETTSDSLGNYSLKSYFKTGITYIIKAVPVDSTGRSKGIKYGNCPSAYYENPGYLNSSDHKKFTYSDTLKNRTYNVCLAPMIIDYIFPDFHFKKNSSEISTVTWGNDETSDTTSVDCFVGLLMANEHWTLEISGHASADESNKKELSEARAKKIFDLLVSKGIDPKRLFYKSYSDKYPYEFRDYYGKIIKQDQAAINIKSRRASIILLSKDFDLPITPAVKTKSTDDDGEE
ncbi:MAG: hypothetical protein JWP12_1235 [Bacteroidetes bacterium]|nr:hypothetical protein [Bacteroidota bacterium]